MEFEVAVHRDCGRDGGADEIVNGRAAATQSESGGGSIDASGERSVATQGDRRVGRQAEILEVQRAAGVDDAVAAKGDRGRPDIQLERRGADKGDGVIAREVDAAAG